MFIEKYEDEEVYDDYFAEDDSVDMKDYSEYDDASIDFSVDIYDLIQSLVDDGVSAINEEFTSDSNAKRHYHRHCVHGRPNIRSTRSMVFYDFARLEDYLDREQYVADLINSGENVRITDLTDKQKIWDAIDEICGKSGTIVFGLSCGFTSDYGRISVAIHSPATEVTTNYGKATVDFIVLAPNGKTITLYPIDADYLKNKIANIVQKAETKELNK